jgi:hypothetical protein
VPEHHVCGGKSLIADPSIRWRCMVSFMVKVSYYADFWTSITLTLQVPVVTILLLPTMKLKTTNMGQYALNYYYYYYYGTYIYDVTTHLSLVIT